MTSWLSRRPPSAPPARPASTSAPCEAATSATGAATRFPAGNALGPGRPAGELDELLLITDSRFHLLKVLSRAQDEGLMLFVDLDRAQTNLGLAIVRVAQAAPAVLA